MKARQRAILGVVTLALLLSPAAWSSQASKLQIQVTLATEEVPFGEPFDLTVVRRWSDDLEPEAWSDDLLAPLVLEEVGVERREANGLVEETRRFRAHAFELEGVEIEAPRLRAWERESGAEVTASAEPIRLRVRSVLDPDDPGEPELPRGPFPAPFPWLWWVAQGALAVAVLGLVGGTISVLRRTKRDGSEEVPPSPAERARARLRAWQEHRPQSPEEVEAWYTELARLIRELLGARFAWTVEEKTHEEILDELESREDVSADQRQRIGEVLEECDHVRFAHTPRRYREQVERMAKELVDELTTEMDQASEDREAK